MHTLPGLPDELIIEIFSYFGDDYLNFICNLTLNKEFHTFLDSDDQWKYRFEDRWGRTAKDPEALAEKQFKKKPFLKRVGRKKRYLRVPFIEIQKLEASDGRHTGIIHFKEVCIIPSIPYKDLYKAYHRASRVLNIKADSVYDTEIVSEDIFYFYMDGFRNFLNFNLFAGFLSALRCSAPLNGVVRVITQLLDTYGDSFYEIFEQTTSFYEDKFRVIINQFQHYDYPGLDIFEILRKIVVSFLQGRLSARLCHEMLLVYDECSVHNDNHSIHDYDSSEIFFSKLQYKKLREIFSKKLLTSFQKAERGDVEEGGALPYFYKYFSKLFPEFAQDGLVNYDMSIYSRWFLLKEWKATGGKLDTIFFQGLTGERKKLFFKKLKAFFLDKYVTLGRKNRGEFEGGVCDFFLENMGKPMRLEFFKTFVPVNSSQLATLVQLLGDNERREILPKILRTRLNDVEGGPFFYKKSRVLDRDLWNRMRDLLFFEKYITGDKNLKESMLTEWLKTFGKRLAIIEKNIQTAQHTDVDTLLSAFNEKFPKKDFTIRENEGQRNKELPASRRARNPQIIFARGKQSQDAQTGPSSSVGLQP